MRKEKMERNEKSEDGTNKRRKCSWITKKEKKIKGGKKREGGANKGEGGESVERERDKWERETKREIFLAFQRSNLDCPRVKVDPHIAGYTWVPKSWTFVKISEVRNFLTWIIYSVKAI